MLGKFNSLRDSALHYLCTSEWSNASFGNVEAPTGYVWRISNTWEDVKPENEEFNGVIEDWEYTLEKEVPVGFWESLVGHFLVVEDSNGFVSVHEYVSLELLLQAYDSLEAIYLEWDGQEED